MLRASGFADFAMHNLISWIEGGDGSRWNILLTIKGKKVIDHKIEKLQFQNLRSQN
jgi:hypothetical protein